MSSPVNVGHIDRSTLNSWCAILFNSISLLLLSV